MKKLNRIKIGFVSTLVTLIAAFSITATVAWFGKSDVINTNLLDGIDGTVLTSYFHCGSGTETDPFVITRPKHWENLVWLHNNIEGFYNANNPSQGLDGKGYYFQIGYDFDEDGDFEVYDYLDDGTPNFDPSNPEFSDILNLSCYSLEGEELIPLGSPQRPFIGELDGSNIELTGFKVVAVDADNDDFQLEDIGIFGYVGPSAYVHDIYFSDYTINTNGAKIHDETDYELHTPHASEDSTFPYPCIGSLAGHIMVAESFENVYTNRCTIEGTAADSQDKLDSYSYYGVVEIPTEGGHVGPGSNYSFTLDSSAVYSYMRQNYGTISQYPMRNRNTEYTGNYPDPEFDGNNKTINPLQKGVAYVTSGLNSYNLIGDDPDNYSSSNPYTGYNYSLSTLGYAPLDDASKSYRYQVKTADGATPSKDMVLTTESLETARTHKATIAEERRYYNASSHKWEYYNLNLKDRGKVPLKIHFKSVHDYNTGQNTTQDAAFQDGKVLLYIDKVLVKSVNLVNGVSGNCYKQSKSVHFVVNYEETIDVSLSMGTHHIALVSYVNNANSDQARCACFYEGSAGISRPSEVSNTLTVNQRALEITENTKDNEVIDISTNSYKGYGNWFSSLTNGYRIENANCTGDSWDENNRKIIDNSSARAVELVGYDLNNPDDTNAHTLSSDGFNFEYDDGKAKKTFMIKYDDSGNIQYDPDNGLPFGVDENGNTIKPDGDTEVISELGIPVAIKKTVQDHDPMWIATMETAKNVKTHTIVDSDGSGICEVCKQSYQTGETVHADAPVFIADDPILTESGYSADNIDVVGGGFQFSNTFVTIDGEDNRALTSPLTSSDVGKKWYATEHAPNSIVLYLSNVGGLNETDVMGNIKFHYSWTLAPILGLDFKSMVFKKGGRTNGYVYMSNNLAMEPGDFNEESEGGLNNMISMVLRRGIVKKCAYAALDKDGNILCGYDSNGNQIANTGAIKESQIKTYVLLVGVKNNLTFLQINTRISKIEFEYLAPSGFGGSFGSVGYRDPYQKLEFTVLNFYFLVPAGDKFRVTVSYSGPDTPSDSSKGRYDVTFLYNSSTHDSLEVLFYLYEIDSYEVYCNGTRVAETGNGAYNVSTSNWS